MTALIFSIFVGTVSAAGSVEKTDALLDGIFTCQAGSTAKEDVQAWLDGALCEDAGGAEWYVLALAQSGEDYDFSNYLQALGAYVSENKISNAVTKQKYALAFLACGVKNEFTAETAGDSVGKLGVMSLVFGLHMAANGLLSEAYTADSILDMLLSRQLADGGFALTGDHADTDVTAMAVQALAHFRNQENVQKALSAAVDCLSALMREDGHYVSYGVVNAESAAQVIMALTALEIDIFTDARFIKNEKTLLDTLSAFRLPSGAFSHTIDGEANANATAQAFCALTALCRMQTNQTPFYDLDRAEDAVFMPSIKEPTDTTSSFDYRVTLTIVLLALALVVCLVLFLTGKRHPKNFLAVAIVLALLLSFVWFVKIESRDHYYGGETEKGEIVGSVTMTIRCDTVAGKDKHIPKDGVILPVTTFTIDANDTVYDILTEAARTYKIQIDKKGADGLIYVSGIGYLYEFDFGDLSGWTYAVNGGRADVGCDNYDLSDGDEIVWEYTLTLGKDFS